VPDLAHDHDLGLAHDLPRLLGRRRALTLLGGFGAAALIGCGNDDDSAAGSSSSTAGATSSSASANGSSGCATIPEETAGPFPGDGTNGPDALGADGVVREDIRSSFGSSSTTAEGIPLRLNLVLVDSANGCQPLSGAAVYAWHCDRDGNYSMYSSGVENENYLRGVQPSDEGGRLTFQSIFPGCYPGRWPHIHFEVYESVDAAVGGGARYSTSQLAIPKDTCDEAYAADGYEQSVSNLSELSLEADGVFADDGAVTQLAAASGDSEGGYTLELTVPVDSTAVSTGGNGGPGGF
jgi:protocatechuate 3,4-dioxygenase beta subunit